MIYDHGCTLVLRRTERLFWGPALAGNTSLRQVVPPGELMRLLGAFIPEKEECPRGGARAHKIPAPTFNHSPRRVAIRMVVLIYDLTNYATALY